MRPDRAMMTVSALLLLSSCAAPAPGHLGVETWTSAPRVTDAMLRMEHLVGETVGDQACFWTGEHPGDGFYVLWPEGSRALENPLRVIDAQGDLIATVGDTISPYGGPRDVAGNCGSAYARAYIVGPPTVEF